MTDEINALKQIVAENERRLIKELRPSYRVRYQKTIDEAEQRIRELKEHDG